MSFANIDDLEHSFDIMVPATSKTLRQLKDIPASFKLVGMMLLSAKNGSIKFHLPTGQTLVFDHGLAGPQADVTVHDFEFAKRSIAGGDIGFAESYMDGQWSTPNLTKVLEFFSENFDSARRLAVGGMFVRVTNLFRHMMNRNSKAGAKKNIEAHYDLGNEFYDKWLDPSMTYSSALYAGPNLSLEQAQNAKYARIADQIGIQPGNSILEIGCGWGGFAEYAAKHRGAKVTCLTISPSQREFAMKRMAKLGLGDEVEVRLEDYRDHRGTYDGIASIEMFEAVGESFWPSYFDKVRTCLKPCAKATLQIITIEDRLFEKYRKRADFIQRYIFPGGMLPSEEALGQQFERAGLTATDVHYFGKDYAKTLRLWAKNFEENWIKINAKGFDEKFRRMWNFYLSYCEAGFDNERIDVGHFTLQHT